jgi:hypothetical protein
MLGKLKVCDILKQTGSKKPTSKLQQWFNEMEARKTGNEYGSEIRWE